MRPIHALSCTAAVLALVACGNGNGEEAVEAVFTDTATVTDMPMRAGMGPMAGGMATAEWDAHMARMRGAMGDSLRGMAGMHRQMGTDMLAQMERQRQARGMGMDSAWVALRDSLHRDFERTSGMSPEEMRAFLDEHDARMRRMMRMNAPDAGAGGP